MIKPLIKCSYNNHTVAIQLQQEVATSDEIAKQLKNEQQMDELLRHLIAAGLTIIDVGATPLDWLAPPYRHHWLVNGQSIGTIYANEQQLVNLIAYYCSATNVLKLPKLSSARLGFDFTWQTKAIQVQAWQEISVIKRQQYHCYSLRHDFYTYNCYVSPDLINALVLLSPTESTANEAIADFLAAVMVNFGLTLTIPDRPNFAYTRLSSYLKLIITVNEVTSYCLLDLTFKELLLNRRLPATAGNNLAALTVPLPLVHGISQLQLTEIMALKVGDIVLFDQVFAPNQVSLDFNNISYTFDLNKQQLIFCGHSAH